MQWIQILVIAVNALTSGFLSKLTVGEMFPDMTASDPSVAAVTFLDIIVCVGVTSSSIQAFLCFHNVFRTCRDEDLKRACLGVTPCVLWLASSVILFSCTEWAMEHPALALLLMSPAFSLINSRMIVCTFTKMQVQPFALIFLWYLLFPINRFARKCTPSSMAACLRAAARAKL